MIFLLITLLLNILLNICVASSQKRRETSFSDILNNYIASTTRTPSVWDVSKIMTFNLDWHSLNWVAGFAGLTWHLMHLLFLVFLNAELMPETNPSYTYFVSNKIRSKRNSHELFNLYSNSDFILINLIHLWIWPLHHNCLIYFTESEKNAC